MISFIQFPLATWTSHHDSPLKLFRVLACAEGKFNLAFLRTGQRRLIFTIKKIPAFCVLGPHSKHCHCHINREAVGKNKHIRSWDRASALKYIMGSSYELVSYSQVHSWKHEYCFLLLHFMKRGKRKCLKLDLSSLRNTVINVTHKCLLIYLLNDEKEIQLKLKIYSMKKRNLNSIMVSKHVL